MTDILKQLNEWEAEATELQNIWERNLNPNQAQCCERIITLTKALKVALATLDEYESGRAMYPSMGSGGAAYLAIKEIEAILKDKSSL